MKNNYTKPQAEKLTFDYEENISASNIHICNGDQGIGFGHGGGCDHKPNHGNPHKPHP